MGELQNNELSTTQAAALARVNVSYIRRLVAKGTIKGRKLGGRYWIVDAADLRRWMSERQERA